MATKRADELNIGDMVNGYDVVTNVSNCGAMVIVMTLCYRYDLKPEHQVEVGGEFLASIPGAGLPDMLFEANSWNEAFDEGWKRLNCNKGDKISVLHVGSGTRKSFTK